MELNGRFIETASWGEGPLTIVLLHEGLGCITLWRDFPEKLAAATACRVFAYSRYGYGQSAPVSLPRPLSYMHDEAALLPDILAAAGIERFILLGHSDGGSIATIFAGSAQNFGLTGLILIAAHFFVEQICVDSIAQAKTAFETTNLREKLQKYHADADNAFWGWNAAWLDPAFRSWRIDDHLPTIRVPILAIQGEADEYGTTAQLDRLTAETHCPVETILIPGAKHSPNITHMPQIIALCANFVARILAF
jgi:pimeloyl-ACP methyl ester carboxylesterase